MLRIRAVASLDALRQDLRCAVRALQYSHGFTVWVIGSLAIGMAVTVAALAFLNAAMLLPFPAVASQDRLVRVTAIRRCGRPDCRVRMASPADYEGLAGGLTGLQGLTAYTFGELAVALPAARSMRGILTSANYFEVLGVAPSLGRGFAAADAETHAQVAVIAHHVWMREFASDPSVIGHFISVANESVQIVGVAPPFFIGIDRVRPGNRPPDVWLPLWLADRVLPLPRAEQRRLERDLYFAGRLSDGITVRDVRAQAEVVAARLAASSSEPSTGSRAEVRRVWIVEPEHWQFGLIIVMPIPILVLVIACVNAANLMLARGSQRQREIAIRLAIGAGRGRIIRQLLMESAILASIATAVALPIAWWALQLASTPINAPIPIDPTVLALTILTAAGTTIGFGFAPALRLSALQPSSMLGSTLGRQDAAPRQSRMRRLLVVAQMALALGLLATAWQLVSTVRAQAVSSGTPAGQLLIARFNLQPLKMPPGDAERFYVALAEGARKLPGIEAAGIARDTSVWTFGKGAAAASLLVWEPTDRPEEAHTTIGGYAGGDLFQALGLGVIHGRGFTDTDRLGRPQVAVVNQTFAEAMIGSALGSFLRVAPRNGDYRSAVDVRVVGVIEATSEPRFEPDARPAAKIYLPSPIGPEPALALYLRTAGPATSFAPSVRELVSSINTRVPILEIGSLAEFNERSYEVQLWLARAAALLGVIGLLLATAGLYGVSSYIVHMRTHELAIRVALGAGPRRILSMMLAQSMRVAVIGLIVGGGAAVAASRIIQSEYHGIVGIDGLAFSGAGTLFLMAMLVASALPAARAARVDPIAALKDA